MTLLSSNAIIGDFYRALSQDTGQSWISQVSMLFQSNQESETYAWLGQAPAMREWIGGRQAKGLLCEGMTIRNKHFEATLEIALRDQRLDKTDQLRLRIQELALRANAHWAKLLTALILAGKESACYDGQPFFSTRHGADKRTELGKSTEQDTRTEQGKPKPQNNRLTIKLADLPNATEKEVASAPSAKAMKAVILKGVQAILGFCDDQGEPMNENASGFLVMVPTSLMDVTHAAIASPVLSGAETNELAVSRNFALDYVVNARLNWEDDSKKEDNNKVVIFRTDGPVAAFIRQEETPVQLKAIAEGTELEFNEDKHRYGVDTWRNVGYGYWQKACLLQMV